MIAKIKNPLIRIPAALVAFVVFLPVAWFLGAAAYTRELLDDVGAALRGE